MGVQRLTRGGRFARRCLLPASLALSTTCAQAAAYLPGAEPDPPTGDMPSTAPTPAEPLRGGGIDWSFGPWRTGGSLTLDMRWLRFEDGTRSRQAGVMTDIETSSYLWQPWFVQVRFGAGLSASTENGSGDGSTQASTSGNTLTGHAQVAVFPASRFPFLFRAEASDSRTSADYLGADQRSRRVTLLQSYRPEVGGDHYQLQVDVSHLLTETVRDTLVTVNGNALQLRGPHRYELAVNWADNHLGDDSYRTRLASVSARHGYNPSPALGIDSLGSWHDTRSRRSDALLDTEFGTEVRQLSTLVTWRPREDELPFPIGRWTQVVGSARWVESRSIGAIEGPHLASFNATLGVSSELTAAWRASLSAAVNQFEGSETLRNATLNGSAQWTPRAQLWGGWRYAPMLSLSAGLLRGGAEAEREFAAAQFTHSVSRDLSRDASSAISVVAAQSAGLLVDAGAAERIDTTTLVHSLGLSWQGSSDPSRQRFASVSLSDSRSRSREDSSFRLVNLQWSQRTQVSRLASWSGSVTLQATRSTLTGDDPISGLRVTSDDGWQYFANGSLHAEQQRLFGVPRLRGTLLASVSSQQLSRRSAGDIDAPLQFVSQSLEGRLDYMIGRLDARLSARAARVDDRNVASLLARVQRRF